MGVAGGGWLFFNNFFAQTPPAGHKSTQMPPLDSEHMNWIPTTNYYKIQIDV